MITKQLNKICKVLVHTKLLPDTFTCKLLYYRKFKKWPNLNNPQDINEKMMWLLFNSDTSEWTNLADKYKVREFLEKKDVVSYWSNYMVIMKTLTTLTLTLCLTSSSLSPTTDLVQ